ncbi:enoyl-CoA hydratase/isomerase family protein [uncultured Williamsia sp.]|uniref:enoyl-CoA hydratase/isomerase family protein n=1 Tax=uncultured Williamsia sp. TaxID=259311 RepID=UPI00262ADC6C|nr:enoyl-CoA hydratase/isomerase family protein [uncultured Williamsia sp.]
MSPDAERLVLVEEADGTWILSLNRPDRRNALTYDSWLALDEAIEAAVEADATAIVLTGAGSFFCAGGDLKSGPAHGSGPLAPAGRVALAQRVLGRLRTCGVPAIAAVEGGAVGLGWSLTLACDLVVAAEDAFFLAPFVTRAVVPDGAITWRLVREVGRHRASDILLRGRRLPASDAHDLGLVTDLVTAGTAVTAAREIAVDLAGSDRGALALTKGLLAATEEAHLQSFGPLELTTATVAQHGAAATKARAEFS